MAEETKEPVFKAATRPQMINGVPMVPLIITWFIFIFIATTLMSWTSLKLWGLTVLLIPILLHPLLKELSKSDPQRLFVFAYHIGERLMYLSNQKNGTTVIPSTKIKGRDDL